MAIIKSNKSVEARLKDEKEFHNKIFENNARSVLSPIYAIGKKDNKGF